VNSIEATVKNSTPFMSVLVQPLQKSHSRGKVYCLFITTFKKSRFFQKLELARQKSGGYFEFPVIQNTPLSHHAICSLPSKTANGSFSLF
jgi:hypothetical protein